MTLLPVPLPISIERSLVNITQPAPEYRRERSEK